MSLDVNLRLINTETGEYKVLENGDFRGGTFLFVKNMINRMDKYGKYVPITEEIFDELCEGALVQLKKEGFADFNETYGIMEFLKILHLREFFAKFGYTLCIEADW